MAFSLAVQRLIDIGYPEDFQNLTYKAGFVVRNAWYDKRLGNLLKTDEHWNILTAFHGFRKLDKKEIRQQYPNKHVSLEETRIFVLNTVFNLSEGVLLASMVDYFDNHEEAYQKLANGTGYNKKGTRQIILYSTIFDDCRSAFEYINEVDGFKRTICSNLSEYIARDDRAVQMMKMLSQHGKKLFLLTNSPWLYTMALMTHVMGPNWQDLFDVVIVNGCKPRWFLQDIAFKEVDRITGKEKVGNHLGPLRKGDVYCRGCATDFIRQMGLAGKDILYVGDHIFGDVLK
ncbi:HAD superfamily hydrolase 5'-nucleotidase [Trichostrongylus colubriformis]|uniref:HAD superfamily hydrolase 5'-nucleotidase n=1 Tax=Trichostrongylus colubriformis TaxID=6319 RepID=A0AAN8IC44_TRICO